MSRATAAFLRTFPLLSLMAVYSVATAAADPMIVGVSGPSINMMYAFVTRDAGLWQKHNSEPRVVLFEAGSVLAQAMLSGDIKMSISSGPAVIASRSQGAEAIIVAAFVNTLPYSLVSAKAITKWDQLKGKRIAISRFGSGTDTAIRLALRKFGLDPVKDVMILQMGSQPDRVRALAAGSIDATLVSPPLDLTAKKQGYNILVNLVDLGIAYPQQVIETTDRFIRENPQGIKSFLKGFIEGVRYAATNKDETKKLIAKYLKVTDAELLEATYQSYLQVTDYGGYAKLDGVQNAMDEVAQRVAVVKTKKPEDFVNTRFLKELEKEGFLNHFRK